MFGLKRRHHQSVIEDIAAWDRERLQFTPDYQQLSQKRAHLVFIHDDMMQLQPNHDMVRVGSLSGFYPFAYGYTAHKFSFVRKELGLKSFPVALELRQKDNLPVYMTDEYRIRGEVYAIRPQQIILLDTHRQNGVQFNRTRVSINIGYRKIKRLQSTNDRGVVKYDYELCKEEMITQSMFMYVGREEYWKDQLEAGFFDFKPVDIILEDRLWLREYYQYSKVR